MNTIIALARTLGLDVTGEGIETDEQLSRLWVLGCTQGQGYYFARPLSIRAIRADRSDVRSFGSAAAGAR